MRNLLSRCRHGRARDARYRRWPSAVRSVGIYTALTVACLLPSAIWVQIYEGIPSYLGNALATVTVEETRTPLQLSQLDLSSMFTGDGLLMLTYYAFWAVPVLAGAVLV